MFLASELYLSSSTGNDFDIRLFSKKKKKKNFAALVTHAGMITN